MSEKNTPKGNVEIEGVNVPEDKTILALLKKYKDKLGSDTVNSFLYLLNKNVKEESSEKNEDKSGRTIRK